ncbi:nucleotidyl transferase AbiEii/AbiGii toxin family protein [Candidatus Woesearchaeota archaeon]|nr:nucleotidyl transferase AbiEii/AbiGii toxin family protein [Candidatus Woesearchaeota archaeon]
MLDYKGLEYVSMLKRLSLMNTEKDYLQDLMLFSIYSHIGRELIFKGGTCLYKIYKLGRFSEDLDFTLNKRIDIKEISKKIVSDLDLLGIKSKIKEIKEYKNELNIRFILNGPLYKGNKETQCFIPLNISIKEKVLLEPEDSSVISLYKELPAFKIFTMQEREILAEKARAIFTRKKPRDIYDLWFLLVTKNTLFDVKLINEKLSLYNIKYNVKEFENKMNDMKNLWETDLKHMIIGDLPDFNKVRNEVMLKIKS